MEDLQRLKKSEPAAFKKAVKLINELMDHLSSYGHYNDK